MAYWSDEELNELQDPELINEAHNCRNSLESEWMEIQEIFKKYPEIFPKDKVNKELFTFAYTNVVTRCFGWDKNCIMLLPLADGINHSCIDSNNEAFDITLHQLHNKGIINEDVRKYAIRERLKIDFSDLIGEVSKEQMASKIIFIGDEIAAVCINMKALDLDKNPYNIWNVYVLIMS